MPIFCNWLKFANHTLHEHISLQIWYFSKIVRNLEFQFLLRFADELDIVLKMKLDSLLIEYHKNVQYLFCKNISITFEVFDTNAFFHKYYHSTTFFQKANFCPKSKYKSLHLQNEEFYVMSTLTPLYKSD